MDSAKKRKKIPLRGNEVRFPEVAKVEAIFRS
jgi:hypothetical protein